MTHVSFPAYGQAKASRADYDHCRETLRRGSKSFFGASALLPKRLNDPAAAIYAFCRIADDCVDLHGEPRAALAALRMSLDRLYRGAPMDTEVERAFADTVAQWAIPRELPEALFEGFEWDLDGRRYDNIEELLDYCVRVAGTVGLMMAVLMGVRDHESLARACDLGIAMQLTNIARDIGEDARRGRLYLPLSWLAEEGVDSDAFLSDPRYDDRIKRLVTRTLNLADHFYGQADGAISALPRDCRPGIFAARYIYAEIGRQIERHECDSISRRAYVANGRKALAVSRALIASIAGVKLMPTIHRARIDGLVQATATAPRHQFLSNVDQSRVARIIGIFEKLEARDRATRAQARSSH
jgi:phytoene synthase